MGYHENLVIPTEAKRSGENLLFAAKPDIPPYATA
jgi:hypothetical protein